jgi:hypothetical protein
MESFMKKILSGEISSESRKYFLRFGKGYYKRRFLLSFSMGSKIKIRGSFEWANDFVKFVRKNKDLNFSGKVMSNEKISGLDGRKKGSSFVYEVEESKLNEFESVYFYLVNCNDSEIILKIKKSLPKPGKNEEKIDDKFCSLDLDKKYLGAVKEAFFWDFPDCKKGRVEHEIVIDEVDIPTEGDPSKVREMAKRKGKIVRKISCDGKESSREHVVEI